jgi:ketosteroid isomerase-like protein
MKRCPTCQRTYTDDSLRFCLQDGTLLLGVSEASASFDPSATLQLPASAPGLDEPPPTGVLNSHTLPISKPAPTATPQPRATAHDAQAFAPSTPKAQNTGLVVGLTVTVVILLLALGSIGAWVLLRDEKGRETGGKPPADNQNSTVPQAVNNERASSNNSVSPGATNVPTPSPSATAPSIDTAAIRDQVTATLNGWSAASMAHDIEKHMSYYADTLDVYYSNTNVSASRVRADRERAYAVFSTIDIRLSNIKVVVEQSGERANATFDKTWNFEGDKYSSGSVQQRIWLAKSGGRWLITGEKDLQVYYVNK